MMSKQTLGFSCIVLLGIFTAAITAYLRIDALYQDEMLERHRLLCEAITRTIDSTVTRTRQYCVFAASIPAMANAANERNQGQAQSLLRKLSEQDSDEALTPPLSLLDNKGNVLASSIFASSQTGNAFFQEAVQGRFALQGPEIAKETNEASMLLASPVTHNSKIVGVLAAHLDLQQLAIDVLPILHDTDMEHAFAFALDSSGKMLMHTNFGALAGISLLDEPWARAMLHRKNGRISYNWAGTPHVAVFASLPKTGWTIAVSLREEDCLAPQRAIRNWFLGCGFVITLLVLSSLLLLRKKRFHLHAGSKLALAELASELRDPSGETPGDEAELLHLGLSAALEKARQSAALLERVISGQSESLHDTLTSMMEGIIHVDEDGAILFANPAAQRMLQCQEKDVLGKRLRTVFRPPIGLGTDSDGLHDVYQAVQTSRCQTFTEKILRRQDESRLLADIVVQPLRKKDGKADSGGTLLALYDVSLMNAQRNMLTAITRATGSTYFVWDEQCRLVDCGDNCTSVLLAPSKQEILKNIAQFMPDYQVNGRDSTSELERHLLHALNTGGASCDWQFKNAMGIVIPCELILRRFERCDRPAVLGFARDVRLLLEATEKLARGHTNLRQILDALPLAVGVIGKGTLLYANHEMEEFFALHGNEPALEPFSPMHSASSASNQDFLQKIDNRHLQLFKPDGSMRDYLLSCFPTEFDEKSALIGWLVDVTGLKSENQRLIRARDQALETIEINKRFLSQLERDVREPLNGMLFTLQHAVQTTSDTEQYQAVNAAYTLGKHLQDTLGYMLHMSGMVPSALGHEITRFEVADFFHEALHGFADEAEAKGITFAFRPDPALPEALVGDRTLLRLTIKHLVDNALKYTVTGGVTVDLRPLPSGKTDTVLLHITITDTGLGISDAQLASLFSSFSDRAQQSKPLSENTSFGLAMVSGYVRLLKGELCALSEPGQGTEMHLVLPFALRLPEDALFAEVESLPFLHIPDAAPVRGNDSVQSKGRILVVDDIATNAQIMILILQKMGYEAISADSGAQALHFLEHEAFDLVFMDIQMPHTSGTEITARIRNDTTGRYPHNIPIVAMTAHAMLGDPEKYLTAGMDDYLSKPVIIEDVANILNNLLRL